MVDAILTKRSEVGCWTGLLIDARKHLGMNRSPCSHVTEVDFSCVTMGLSLETRSVSCLLLGAQAKSLSIISACRLRLEHGSLVAHHLGWS